MNRKSKPRFAEVRAVALFVLLLGAVFLAGQAKIVNAGGCCPGPLEPDEAYVLFECHKDSDCSPSKTCIKTDPRTTDGFGAVCVSGGKYR